MKVFKMSDCDWYFGETEQDAIDAYIEASDDLPEAPYPELLTEDDLNDMPYSDCLDDPEAATRSFYEQLQIVIARGDEANLFATSEF